MCDVRRLASEHSIFDGKLWGIAKISVAPIPGLPSEAILVKLIFVGNIFLQ